MWEAFHTPHTRGRTGPHLLRVNSPSLPHSKDSTGGREGFSFPQPSVSSTHRCHRHLLTPPLLTPGTETQFLHLAPQRSSGRHEPGPHKHSALAPTPSPYPALLRWFFLGIKLTLGQMFPCRSECGGKTGMPHYTQPSISLHWLFPEIHVIPSDPKEDFVRPRTQLHSSHKEPGHQDTGINTANQQWLCWPTCQIKAATALLKSQPLSHGNPPRGINSLTFSPTKKPFKSRRSSSSVGNLSTVTHL